MTLAHTPDRPDPSDDRGPDSGDLRVTEGTAHESGIPPARDRLTRERDDYAALAQLELVLVESTRAEANLGLLMRGVKHLEASAAAAREANAVLAQELESLRARMSEAYASESMLRQRVRALENAVDAGLREREAWLLQEDAFLAGLLDEHEQKLLELEQQHERQLGELDFALDELRRERENARTEVMRLTYERDAAVALLNEPVDSGEVSHASSPMGRLGSVRLPKPILKPRPDVTSRPLVGYSLSGGEVADEQVDDMRPTSRPPRP